MSDSALSPRGSPQSDILERLRESPLPSLNRIVRDRRDAADEIESLEYQKRLLLERLEANFAWQFIDGVKTKIAVEPGSIPDGIECRDETIKLQDERIKELTERLRRAQGWQ